MPIPDVLAGRLRLPAIAAPMFIISNPALVIAQCRAGIVGSFPALSARSHTQLDDWLGEIVGALAAHDRTYPKRPAAPFAVNLIVHRTNQRLDTDLELCRKYRVPLVITSLGARQDLFTALHDFGAFAFHDVISDAFGRKAIARGADGLVAVAAGAGGHASALSPFALVTELRRWFSGPLALSGAIATGHAILAARVLGADFAYLGSAFIATHEAKAVESYKRMVVDAAADDIIYTDFFSGVRGNYLKPSIVAAGLDPDRLGTKDPATMSFANGGAKTWRDIWGCGQGIGAIDAIVSTSELIDRLAREYEQARNHLCLVEDVK